MAKTKNDEKPKAVRPFREREVSDPDGEAWHRKAQAELERASNPRARKEYQPVPLPDFAASKAAVVSREVLGRFLEDRDAGIVHDVTSAVESCGIDAIRSGTFYHFASEVPEEIESCPACLP